MSHTIKRLKFVCRLGYGGALTPELVGEEIPVFGSNGVYATAVRANTQSPTIIVGRKGSYGKINWSERPCFASDTTFFIDKTLTNEDLRWLFWVLQTLRLDEGSNEAAVPGVNRGTVYEKKMTVPPIDTQRFIAHYLDNEIAQIEALIEEKERMLALLEEKRAALISRAVTCGLDTDAPLKSSGYPWLGDIPAHWELRRCASLFKEIDERNEPDLPLLNVSLNTGVTLRVFSDNKIESVAADFATYKVARKGNLVFNKMRFWQGAVGIAPENGLTSPDYTVAEFGPELNADYIEFLFRIPQFIMEVRRHSHGIVDDRLRLYWDGFKKIYIPVPPLSEQKTIAANLAAERDKTYDLETKLNKSITLLKERRSALITAAVTGQIQIPGISPEKEVRYAN